MSRRIAAAGALLAALVLVPGASADQSYFDPPGDATGGAPDITAIRVVNDIGGTITFSVSVAGFPAPETFVDLYLDLDRNGATGDQGIEMQFELDGSNLNTYAWCWNGSASVACVPSSARFDFQNGLWRLSIDDSDLGGPRSLDFYYISFKTSGDQEIGRDDAPNGTSVYTYTLTGQTPPPPSPPPPPPEPRQRTYEDAPRLPSRIRYIGNSIKHVRIGEKMYATMKRLGTPRVVATACWSEYDWPSVLESIGERPTHGNVFIAGFWHPAQPRWIHLSPKQCRDIQALISTRAINGQRAYALATALHERVHAEGIRNEAQTNCYAVQLIYEFARELNFVHTRAIRLEQLGVRKTRATAPRGYWNSAFCRDGGKWDIYPEFRNLDY